MGEGVVCGCCGGRVLSGRGGDLWGSAGVRMVVALVDVGMLRMLGGGGAAVVA